jgi:uncharacterized membrane protein YeaQ/YmgE (transglycosylase-associated protein family)
MVAMGWLAWIAIGFFASMLARVILPLGRRIGCAGSIGLGLLGSLVGGTIGNVLAGDGADLAASGLFGSVLGTLFVIALLRTFGPGQQS